MTLAEGTKISGGELRICRRCSKPFVYYKKILEHRHLANHCPECLDKLQSRPSVVVERECNHKFSPVIVNSLPSENWQEFDTGYESDVANYRLDVKGAIYGANWSGRIVIYAPRPISKGDVVTVREMVARHKVKRTMIPHTHGTVTYIVDSDVTQQDGEEHIAEHPYIVIEPVNTQTEPFDLTDPDRLRLVWKTAHTKTTLKGYGRQYYASLDAGNTIWHKSISGGVRSGRAYTVGVLAICTATNPLIYRFREGSEEEVSIFPEN